MARPVQEWLNEEFLSSCLQGEDNCLGKVEVIKFTCEPCVPEGNNFGSCISRVKVEFKLDNEEKTQTKSLILKSPLQNEDLAELFNSSNDIETEFYSKFLSIAGQFGFDCFAPKRYNSPNPSVIVMEDLREQGYIMEDRSLQLDYDHCRLYVMTSATFHAVSIAIHKDHAELVESLGKEKIFSNDLNSTGAYKMWLNQGSECASDYMEGTEFKKYAKLVRESKSYLFELVVEAHKPSEGLKSLNQGDPWITNMMFKYDKSGKVSQNKLLDFQALRYGSPVNDIVYFLFTSANNDVREHRLDDIFLEYCETLNNKLQELNCSERLSYNDFLNKVKLLNPLMLFLVLAFLPIILHPEATDLDDLIKEETDCDGKPVNKMRKYFTQHFCDNVLLQYLRQLERLGVFEYFKEQA